MGHPNGIDNLENTFLPVDPVDAPRVEVGLVEELLDELPEVNVGGGPGGGRGCLGGRGGRGQSNSWQRGVHFRSCILI